MEDKSWSEALYGPLPLAGDSLRTRFLRIHRGTGNDKLECTLFTSTLIGPRYEALSYTWGTDAQTNPVIINGVIAGVTVNLRDAMIALRRPDKSRVMWIDAVCIDQSDTQERGHQVQQMGDIYQCAARVVVWLGPESDESGRLFRVIRSHPYSTDVCFNSRPLDRVYPSMCFLLRRRYWTRVWIVQEIARAKSDPVLLCGKEELSWSVLCRFLSLHRESPETRQVQLLQTIRERVHTPPRLRLYGDEVPTRSQIESSYIEDLLFLLGRTDKFDATDPRDKVFALFGMTRGSTQAATADYGRSVARVFIDLAKTAISRTGSLNVTSYSTPSNLATELPTWVPDFASRHARAVLTPRVPPGLSKILDKRQGYAQVPIFTNEGMVLRVIGRLVDTIYDTEFSTDASWTWKGVLETLYSGERLQVDYEEHVRQRFLYWQRTSQPGHYPDEAMLDFQPNGLSLDDWAVALYNFDIQLHASNMNDWKCHPITEKYVDTNISLREDLIGALDVHAFLRRLQETNTPEAWTQCGTEDSWKSRFMRWKTAYRTDADVILGLIEAAVRAYQAHPTWLPDTHGRTNAILCLISTILKNTTSICASFLHALDTLDPEFRSMSLEWRLKTLGSEEALQATRCLINILQSHPEVPSGPCPWPPGVSTMVEALGRISYCSLSQCVICDFKPAETQQGCRAFSAKEVDARPGDQIVSFNKTTAFKLLRRLAPAEGEDASFQLLGDVYVHSPDVAKYLDTPLVEHTWHEYKIV